MTDDLIAHMLKAVPVIAKTGDDLFESEGIRADALVAAMIWVACSGFRKQRRSLDDMLKMVRETWRLYSEASQ